MSPIPTFRVATAAALSLVLASAAHAAADPAPTDAATKPRDSRTAPEPAPAEEPRLICEQVQQMGSHFRRKVCATPEAWEARRRKDAAQMEKMGDQGSGCGGVANPC